MKDPYIRTVKIVRVIDGDTVIVDVDLGFYVTTRIACRLVGINTPELNQKGGKEAKAFLEQILVTSKTVEIQSVKADKYAGRFDAIVVVDGINVNELMVQSGCAVPWDGKGEKPIKSTT